MAAHQAPPSLGFSRQEHWSGLSFPSPMHESEKWKWSRVQLLVTAWTAAHQAPPSMGFSRQEFWSGVPLPLLRHTRRPISTNIGLPMKPSVKAPLKCHLLHEDFTDTTSPGHSNLRWYLCCATSPLSFVPGTCLFVTTFLCSTVSVVLLHNNPC